MALMNKLLTVVITTYNRKQCLLETLKSFEVQGNYNEYKIIISNNCSDYNVNEWLSENLTNDFLSIITIFNRPFNVGGDINIAFSFQLCDTKWMWLMSDDDIVTPDSLSIVLSDIAEFPEVAHVKYSIIGYDALPDRECNNLIQVLDTFLSKNISNGSGQFIFMSNNLINLEKVGPYIGKAPYYASTCITQLIPSIFAIWNENKIWKISSKFITNCETGRISYEPIYATVNLTNIQLIDTNFSDIVIKKIKQLFDLKDRKNLVKNLLSIESKEKRRMLFYKVWFAYYSGFSKKGILFSLYYNFKKITG